VNNSSPLEQRFVELEIRATHQQKHIDELNAVVTELNLKMLRLETKIVNINQQNDQMKNLLRENLPDLPHERPPHY
jgi:uncharacterized coiled-coil protein SlyX